MVSYFNMISTTYVQLIPAVNAYFANIIAQPPDLTGCRANDTAKGGASTQPHPGTTSSRECASRHPSRVASGCDGQSR